MFLAKWARLACVLIVRVLIDHILLYKQTQGRQGAVDYTFLVFGFKIPNSGFKRVPCTSQIRWLLGSHFAFPVSRWASIPGISGEHISQFLFLVSLRA